MFLPSWVGSPPSLDVKSMSAEFVAAVVLGTLFRARVVSFYSLSPSRLAISRSRSLTI
jgi:hypothetical protein